MVMVIDYIEVGSIASTVNCLKGEKNQLYSNLHLNMNRRYGNVIKVTLNDSIDFAYFNVGNNILPKFSFNIPDYLAVRLNSYFRLFL